MCITNNFNLGFMKRLPAFVLGNLLAMQAFAYDFQSGGLCYNITSGSQPLTVEVTYLSYDDNYPDLTKAEIPSSVTNDGKEYAVTAVGKNAFNYCSKLTSVSIPSSVKTIGVRAFFGCKGLSKVIIPNSVTDIGNSAFNSCNTLASVTIGSQVKTIGDYAFSFCNSLTSLTIPNSTKSVGKGAFNSCISLGKLTIGNSVEIIGEQAFANCSLIDITIPNSVKTIENKAFESNKSLQIITVGNSVTEIGATVFANCPNLTTVNLGTSVKKIEDGAFGLNTIVYVVSDNQFGVYYPLYFNGGDIRYILDEESAYLTIEQVNNNVQTLDVPETITIGAKTLPVTNITERAFANCKKLKSLSISKSVKEIAERAFANCSSLDSIGVDVANPDFLSVDGVLYNFAAVSSTIVNCFPPAKAGSYMIPAHTKAIGGSAFMNCAKLTELDIPSNVDSITANAFVNCESITKLSYNTAYIGTLFSGKKKLATLIVGDLVENVAENAFSGCSGLTSVTIPDEIGTIGAKSFDGCKKLVYNKFDSAVYLGNATNPYVVLMNVVSKDKTDKCDIHNQTKLVYMNAFANCKKLTTVSIPDGVRKIDDAAFSGCGELTSVTMTNSVFEIGNNAFSGCAKLTDIAISDSITIIGANAFKDCSKLKYNQLDSVLYLGNSENKYVMLVSAKSKDEIERCAISETARIIYDNAFDGCKKLSEISIPNSVVSIGKSAFKGCDTLDNVVIPNTISAVDVSVFNGCKGLRNLTANISDEVAYNVTLASNNEKWGFCYISKFELADSKVNVTIQAAAAAKVDSVAGRGMFAHWSDSEDSTAMVRKFTLTDDLNLTAIFEKDPTGIEEQQASNILIYSYGNTVVVENANAAIRVYNSMGRLVAIGNNIADGARNELPINESGVYIVQVGKTTQRIIIK